MYLCVPFYMTGGACRLRACETLAKKFEDPTEAEKYFTSVQEPTDSLSSCPSSFSSTPSEDDVPSSTVETTAPTLTAILLDANPTTRSLLTTSPNLDPVDIVQQSNTFSVVLEEVETIDSFQLIANSLGASLEHLDVEDKLRVISVLYCKIADQSGVSVPDDYLKLSLDGMKQLKTNGRRNLLYGLAKGLGTVRSDGTDSVFPTRKVVCGLLEYSVEFFNSNSPLGVSHWKCCYSL